MHSTSNKHSKKITKSRQSLRPMGVDTPDQPPSDPSFSTPPATSTYASSSATAATSATSGSTPVADLAIASTRMASSTNIPVLTADNITRIVNEHVKANLVAATSAVPVKALPHGVKLKTFSVASKDWLNYD